MTMQARPSHRPWILALLAALLFAVTMNILTTRITDHFNMAYEQMAAKKNRLTLQLDLWRNDAQTARTIRENISELDIARLLEPGNRKSMTAKLEPLATAHHLVNMTYTLSPPQPWDGGTQFPGIEGVVVSTLTLESDAPHDGAIYAFLSQLKELQGRLTIQELHIGPISEPNATPSALNLHMKAKLEWLVNREEEGSTP